MGFWDAFSHLRVPNYRYYNYESIMMYLQNTFNKPDNIKKLVIKEITRLFLDQLKNSGLFFNNITLCPFIFGTLKGIPVSEKN